MEVIGGIGIILTGFMKGLWGKLLTRIFAFILTVLMMFALVLAHSDWLISVELFQNIQIFCIRSHLYISYLNHKIINKGELRWIVDVEE